MRLPLLLLAWCAGLVAGNTHGVPALAGPLSLGGLALGAAAMGVVLVRPRAGHPAMLLPALILFGAARGAAVVHVPGPSTMEARLGQHVTVVGTVARAGGSTGLQSFRLAENRFDRTRVEGQIQVSARSAVTVVPGSRVRATGTLERLPGRAYDGTTGYDDRLERQGVLAAMAGVSYTVLEPPSASSLTAMAWRARASLSAGVRARVPEPEASILLGELVGIRGRLPPPVELQLVNSGLVHLLAVSGLKVAILASVLAALLRQAGRRAALMAIVGVVAYALVGGASAAATRAAVMGSLALVAQVLRRDPDPPRSMLLAAAPMLTLDPALATDLSFQYSFLGVAGIQLMQPAISRRLGRVPRLLRDALSVTLAAQVATLPLTAAYFHVIALSAPLTNAVAIPMLGPSMAAAAWSGLRLPDPAGVIAAGAAGSARVLLGLAALCAGAPGLAVAVPWFGAPHALAYLASLAAILGGSLVHRPQARRPRPAHGALATPAVVMAVAAVVLLLTSRPDGRLHLVFLDTPGGGALVTAPDGARLLVDSGSSAAKLGAALDAQLAPGTPPLDALLLTASTPPAAGGLEGLGARRPLSYLGPAATPGDVPGRLAAALAAHRTTVSWLNTGDRVSWHGVDLLVEGCGSGLALTLRYGATVAWICDAGVAGDAGVLPQGRLAAVDVGPGDGRPDGAWAGAAWVVAHGSGRAATGVAVRGLGPRLWRPARDGPLELGCDLRGCSRS